MSYSPAPVSTSEGLRIVLGFDGWTEGSINYQRLVKALEERGFRLELVHLGSWGHDKGRAKSEMIGPLPVYDISYFEGLDFPGVLGRKKPAAVIFLSTESFLHRAFNRYARAVGVPTLHLYHGLIGVQAVESGQPDRYRVLAQLKIILARTMKVAFTVWPLYMRALWVTKARFSEWRRFATDLVAQGLGRYRKEASEDASTDFCAVYTKADVWHAVSKYHVPESRVRVVGNPDLNKFGLETGDFGIAATPGRETGNEVMFIDHGGSTCGFVFRSVADFVAFLSEMEASLRSQGLALVVKLHPAQYLTQTPQLLEAAGIALCENAGFVVRLKNCRAAIVTPSSASLLPALLGLPL
ncbi:MAG: hypothetical protein JO256_08760, partial [Alphaproteobacteria bacterium]|nr:hypothetical protein [Alphaproteobacteria bacterium]